MRIKRGSKELDSFDDLHADVDDRGDQRSRIRFQMSVLCDVDRFSHSLGGLRTWFVLLLVGLVIGTAYALGIDPLPIIKELLAGGLRE
jgi:hypothetical protein